MAKEKVLQEWFDNSGRSRLVMWSDPVTIYTRRDGSLFVKVQRKRYTIIRRPDGILYMAIHPKAEVEI